MLLNKFKYLAGNAGIAADVATIHFPVAQLFHGRILGWHDANSDLCRLAQVRTVEGDRRNWPSPQSPPVFLAQALEKPIFQHIWPSRPPRSRSSPELHGASYAIDQGSERREPRKLASALAPGWC